MKRSAFTLMELLVSVILIALITLFMYGAIAASKQTGRTLDRHANTEQNRTLLYTLLYRDLIEALSVQPLPTQNRRFTVVQLQTRNTLYDIAAPYVTWYVNARTQELIRLESARKIGLPVPYEQKMLIHADRFAAGVSDFNLYTATGTEDNTSQRAVSSAASSSESLSSEEDRDRRRERRQAEAGRMPGHMFLYLNTEKMPRILLELAL